MKKTPKENKKKNKVKERGREKKKNRRRNPLKKKILTDLRNLSPKISVGLRMMVNLEIMSKY